MRDNPFSDLETSPAVHFRLCFYGAVTRLVAHLTSVLGSFEKVFSEFPFLGGYSDEIAERGIGGLSIEEAGAVWDRRVQAWEEAAKVHLPIRALREVASVDTRTLELVMFIALGEEDSRFGDVFEALQNPPGRRRPTYGLLRSMEEAASGQQDRESGLRRFVEMGIVQVSNPESPRSEWILQIPPQLLDVLRGCEGKQLVSGIRYLPPDDLEDLSQLVIAEALKRKLKSIPDAMSTSEIGTVIVRGARRSGRRTAVRSVAKALSLGILEVDGFSGPGDERYRLIGPLSTALAAMPMVMLDLSPGETVTLPDPTAYNGPRAVVLGRQGGLSGTWTDRSVTLSIDTPDARERFTHWTAGTPDRCIEDVETVAERYRMTGGNIRRAASVASACASAEQRTAISTSDVRIAIRSLNHESLDGLAEHVETTGDWTYLAVPPHTLDELHDLEARCRWRERLRNGVTPALGAHLNAGVRALFTGPSGTGKSLAARLLANSLEMDLYRINLGTVVNKYIGETEKNLDAVFSRAEELPVILLLDEGDALLTQRTHVQTSNDRYANLETNFLLQRLESFEGIIVVTTNAGDRIDSAFARRMDVVVDFRAPDGAERLAIWNMFLPASHNVSEDGLSEIAVRCSMTGAQIRNAVLDASLAALTNGGIVTDEYVEAAIRKEYRKLGAACPLRPQSGQ